MAEIMNSYFFVGIGGSGMMPLAEIVAAQGHCVAGSDRSLDQGRLGAKFEGLAAKGIGLHAQDGSGIVSADQIVVASAAVEATALGAGARGAGGLAGRLGPDPALAFAAVFTSASATTLRAISAGAQRFFSLGGEIFLCRMPGGFL